MEIRNNQKSKRTDNTIEKRAKKHNDLQKNTQKSKIKQYEPHQTPGLNSGTPEG